MNYVFTEEELIKYQVFEYLGVLPNLDVFLEENIIVMHKEFLKLIKKMEKEQKNERKEKFLKNIEYEDFIEILKKRFAINLEKELEKECKSNILELQLKARQISKEMSNDTQNAAYQKFLKEVVKSISNDILKEYRELL
ncbi:MAG: hypothetical protein ACLS90_05840 [Clostridia bacterium]